MDIHKPKPWHGWREFAKELATIILGIVIALALEGVVQAAREAGQAGEARANIRRELADNLGKMAWRASAEDCHVRRLSEVQDLLDRAGRGEPLPQPVWIGEPDVWEMSTIRWEAAAQAGRASLLSADDQAAFARVYSHMRVFAETGVREQQAWSQLRALERERTIDPPLRTALLLALQEARFDRFRTILLVRQATRQAAEFGVKPNTAPFRGFAHRTACIPLATSIAEGQRLSNGGGLQDEGVHGPSE